MSLENLILMKESGRNSPHMVQFSSVAQSCLTNCDPMDFCMPVFPVHQQLLELAQTPAH